MYILRGIEKKNMPYYANALNEGYFMKINYLKSKF